MNDLKHIALFAVMAVATCTADAQCSIDLGVSTIASDESVPQQSTELLNSRLHRILSESGIVADEGLCQFFIAGKFDYLYQDELPGPPAQTVIHTELTLYIGDTVSETVYASTTLNLRGVGHSERLAISNALKNVNTSNPKIKDFVEIGKAKVLDYFNINSAKIIAHAKKAASLNDFEQAMWLLCTIPECCDSYNEASTLSVQYYKSFSDRTGKIHLDKAIAEWAKSPNRAGAEKAFGYLAMIEPESECYSGAENLAAEIKCTIKDDKDFELREKYHDAVGFKQSLIDSARQIGVAYGKNQQAITTNINWIR